MAKKASADMKAQARIAATRQMLKGDRMYGFKTTGSALDAIYANLATTQRGIAASQTVANARTAAALERLSGRTRAASRRIAGGAAKAERNQYGSVAGAAADFQDKRLEAAVKSAKLTMRGERQAGAVGIKGAADVLGIIAAGAQEAKAGAAGQLADALAYRAKNDAQIVAGMQQARMDANLQFQTWKRQQEYLAKQEQKAAGGKLQGASTAVDSLTQASSSMRSLLENGDYANPDALVNAYISGTGGQPMSDSEKTAWTVLARQLMNQHLYGGTGTRDQETAAIMDSLHVLYPDWNGHQKEIRSSVTAGLNSVYATATATAAANRAAWLDSHPEGNTSYQRDAALASVLTDGGKHDDPGSISGNRQAAIQRAVAIGMDPRVAESYIDMLINTVDARDLVEYAANYHEDQLTNFGQSPS